MLRDKPFASKAFQPYLSNFLHVYTRVQYAEKTKIPPELVIELAIAYFLDPDSMTFDDYQVRVEKSSIIWLKEYADASATAA